MCCLMLIATTFTVYYVLFEINLMIFGNNRISSEVAGGRGHLNLCLLIYFYFSLN